jgi:hypothetical protein
VGHLSQFEPFANFMAVSSNLIFSGDVGWRSGISVDLIKYHYSTQTRHITHAW